MPSPNIINVNEHDFEFEVIAYSQNIPVVVFFWAGWSKPCKETESELTHIFAEIIPSIRLARVDIEANPGLPMRFGIRSIPTLMAFSQGQMTSELTGQQPEYRLREFLSKLSPPSPHTLAAEKANADLWEQKWQEAEKQFRQILEQDNGFPAAMLGLAEALIPQGKIWEAVAILEDFPPSKEYLRAEKLMALVNVLRVAGKPATEENSDLDLTFENSLRLLTRGNLPAAMDGMLEVLRQNKHYGKESARQAALGMLELFGPENQEGREYRQELAAILH